MREENRHFQSFLGMDCPHALAAVSEALILLQRWVETRQFTGYEPYDLLNSKYFGESWNSNRYLTAFAIQIGKRSGSSLRSILAVPRSTNPKALGLFLSSYCDLAVCGMGSLSIANEIKTKLKDLRDDQEPEYAWGYDWNYASFRGGVLRKFRANSVATVFCGMGLLDLAESYGDEEALVMAQSVSKFCATRLRHSFETHSEVCFSYTPAQDTLVLNSSALVGAFLARCGAVTGDANDLSLARRAMAFLAAQQRVDGSWVYGLGQRQQWVDSIHTAYNLLALWIYRRCTGDHTFDSTVARGCSFYIARCFTSEGVPKYRDCRVYPIDIHTCAQAIVTLTAYAEYEPSALSRAWQIAIWTLRNMQSMDGSFFYQRHRFSIDRTPYMRWGQAWMFRALAALLRSHHLQYGLSEGS